MPNFPISRVCPQCGSKEYTLRSPQSVVAFADDRVCKVCHTRYSPPTPVWGGVVFLLSGMALPILGFVLIALLINPFSIAGLVFQGVVYIFAIRVFIGGIRMLANSTTVGGTESVRDSSSNRGTIP